MEKALAGYLGFWDILTSGMHAPLFAYGRHIGALCALFHVLSKIVSHLSQRLFYLSIIRYMTSSEYESFM